MKILNNAANMKDLSSFVRKNTQIKPFFINVPVTNVDEEFFSGLLSAGQNFPLSSNIEYCSFV